MQIYRIEADAAVELDVEAAFEWYEAQYSNLGLQFLNELRLTYVRLSQNPRAYQVIKDDIRRILMRQFPYAVYFVIENDLIIVLGVLHTARDPEEWQTRIG